MAFWVLLLVKEWNLVWQYWSLAKAARLLWCIWIFWPPGIQIYLVSKTLKWPSDEFEGLIGNFSSGRLSLVSLKLQQASAYYLVLFYWRSVLLAVPPATLNKIIPLEIRSPLSLAISYSAWVHKKGRERVHWIAFDLILNALTLFCVMDGIWSGSLNYF